MQLFLVKSYLISLTLLLNVINVNKILYMVNNDTRIDRELDIDDSSIEYIENVTSSKANESYVLYEDGISLSFTFGNLDSSLTDNNAYNVKPSGFKYIKRKFFLNSESSVE